MDNLAREIVGRIEIGLCLGACLLMAGCFVLPIPHCRTHLPEASLKVVDGVTGKPIAHAIVVANNDRYHQFGETDVTGKVVLPEQCGWHLVLWAAVPSGGSLLPRHDDPGDAWVKTLKVSAKGYWPFSSHTYPFLSGLEEIELMPIQSMGGK